MDTTVQQPPDKNAATEDEQRAAMVAAIRALAAFVEKRTDLPVPNSVHAQHSLSGIDPGHADTVREVAARLGIKPRDGGGSVWHHLAKHPVSVRYVVYGVLSERDVEDKKHEGELCFDKPEIYAQYQPDQHYPDPR